MSVIDWGHLQDIALLVFSAIVTVSTVCYVILTCRLVSETRRLREVQTEPRVSVQIEPDNASRGYQLVIRNAGQGPAKNVRFDFRGDPTYFRNSWVGNAAPPTVDQLPTIKDGIEHMEPGYTLPFSLGTVSPEEFNRAIQDPWKFDVRYENFSGARKKDTYVIDFNQFRGQMFEELWLKQITNHLRDIRNELRSVNQKFRQSQSNIDGGTDGPCD